MKKYVSDKEPREWKSRLRLPTYIVISVFVLLACRLWFLQVIDGARYKGLSQSNRIRLVHTTAPRGLIFDRNGTRIAENRPGFDLLIVREDVKDWQKTKLALTKLVEITPEEIEERLKRAKKRPQIGRAHV